VTEGAEAKLYTVVEANELLPYLAPTLVELREKSEEAVRVQEAVEVAASTNGGSAKREKWSQLLARVAELAGRLEEWQLVLRDLSQGLVDFPAVVDGSEAYLCWRLGEAEVTHWHPRDTGFAGRRPL
jgi:hypothetical protein